MIGLKGWLCQTQENNVTCEHHIYILHNITGIAARHGGSKAPFSFFYQISCYILFCI